MNKYWLKENRIHGHALFPLDVYTMRYTNPNSSLECHWHDELELLLLTEGRAVVQIETTTQMIEAGQAVFVNSGELHAAYPADGHPWGFKAIVFSADLVASGHRDTIQSQYLEPLLNRQYALAQFIEGISEWECSILACLRAIASEFQDKPFTYEMFVKARLLDILSELLQNSRRREDQNLLSGNLIKTERIKKVLTYIHTEYIRRITLSELSELVGMSEGHFCRFFKQLVNRTPLDYINWYKINKAARLLEETGRKITDIAMEVGFDNLSYFINLFKHYHSCTPSEYRRNANI